MLSSTDRWLYLRIDVFLYLYLDGFDLTDAAIQPQLERAIVAHLPDFASPVPSAAGLPHFVLQRLLLIVNLYGNNLIILERLARRLPVHLFDDQFDSLEAFLPLLIVTVTDAEQALAILRNQLFRAAPTRFDV